MKKYWFYLKIDSGLWLLFTSDLRIFDGETKKKTVKILDFSRLKKRQYLPQSCIPKINVYRVPLWIGQANYESLEITSKVPLNKDTIRPQSVKWKYPESF